MNQARQDEQRRRAQLHGSKAGHAVRSGPLRPGLACLPAGVLVCLIGIGCSREDEREAEQSAATVDPVACEELADALQHRMGEATVELAAVVAAGGLELGEGVEVPGDLPQLCRVVGTLEPEIAFEVWLPTDSWNGRYRGVGNGGMAGTISYASMAPALRAGFATASTDTGHASSGRPFDASWASGRPELVADFGHRALHLTTVAAKQVVELFYGRPPEFSYYTGCSKGGQQGLMEAQRYPTDFDGILVGNPANDWTRFYAGAHLWYAQATLADEESWISPKQVEVLGRAVNEACDELDGIADGVLDDPRECRFDPRQLACDGGPGDHCLSPKQVAAVEKIWSGVTNSSGEVVFPGLVPGGEASPGGWALWVTGSQPFGSLHWLAGEGFFRHMVFEDPDWDFRSFDYDHDLEYALDKVGGQLDAADPDLAAFRDAGGKLLVYHGWSDADISALGSVRYWNDVVDHFTRNEHGGGSSDAPSGAEESERVTSQVQDFYRLFLVPGLGHCFGGPGITTFGAFEALQRWVEEGTPPETLPGERIVEGSTAWTRPVCAYPRLARWNGQGDWRDAANFACE